MVPPCAQTRELLNSHGIRTGERVVIDQIEEARDEVVGHQAEPQELKARVSTASKKLVYRVETEQPHGRQAHVPKETAGAACVLYIVFLHRDARLHTNEPRLVIQTIFITHP